MRNLINRSLLSKSGVYIIRNSVNRKVYVGSAHCLRKRYNQHLGDLKRGNHKAIQMQAFANKYGIDCMEFDLLEIVDDKANILSVEQKWLDHYTPFNEKGFNTCRFAGNTTGWVPPPEKRQMLSKLLKGVPRTQEVKEKIRSAKIGEKSHLYGKRGEDCHNFGKVRTAEMKEAIANTLRGRTLPENQKKAISESLKGKTKHPGTTLFQFDQTGKEVGRWYSVEEASKTLGISDSNISACIKGRRKIAGGFLWERR